MVYLSRFGYHFIFLKKQLKAPTSAKGTGRHHCKAILIIFDQMWWLGETRGKQTSLLTSRRARRKIQGATSESAFPWSSLGTEGDLINKCKYLNEDAKKTEPDSFSVIPNARKNGNEHKQEHERFHLNIRKTFFIVSVTKHWHRLSREGVGSPSLEISKSCMGMFLGNLL